MPSCAACAPSASARTDAAAVDDAAGGDHGCAHAIGDELRRARRCPSASPRRGRRNDGRWPPASKPVATIRSTPASSSARASAIEVAAPIVTMPRCRHAARRSRRGTPNTKLKTGGSPRATPRACSSKRWLKRAGRRGLARGRARGSKARTVARRRSNCCRRRAHRRRDRDRRPTGSAAKGRRRVRADLAHERGRSPPARRMMRAKGAEPAEDRRRSRSAAPSRARRRTDPG